MTKRTSLLTRCLALALALVLIIANVNLGVALRAFAAEGEKFLDSDLVASNYDLSDADVALLTSGMLASETRSYDAINGDGLVTVDTEKKQITAAADGNWAPVSATVVVSGAVKETVALTNGVGTYTYDGNNFALNVEYVLYADVPAETQKALLNAGALLKNGVANMDAVVKTDTNLGVVVAALPSLDALIAQGLVGDEAVAAVNALKAQASANGDKLNLQVMVAAYGESVSKAAYAVENGAAVKAEVAAAYGYLKTISADDMLNHDLADQYLKETDPTNYNLWMAFKECLSTLVGDLEKVNGADWTNTTVLAKGVDYANLDALVAAITGAPAVEVKAGLAADTAVVTWINDTMMNVNVSVVLKDANEFVTTVAVEKSATEEQIVAAVEATGVEAAALKTWGIDVAHYDRTAASATVEGVLTYTITYAPKNYTVTYSYADSESVPYGTEITLPVHEDATKSYDYIVNGEKYAQGDKYVVVGDTEISRTSGKAYRVTDLYSVVGDNAGNEIVKAILESGALTGNQNITVRQPDATDDGLLTLKDLVLTAPNYDASFKGLSWVPYSFGATVGENLFSGNTASWSAVEAKVSYRLYLDGYNAEEIIALAKELKTDADAQVAALERLNNYYADMATLNKTQLGGFVGMVAYTDLTPGDGTDTDAKNLELREYFTALINDIINNNLTGTNLTIYNMVTEYQNGGLRYYYDNAAAVRAEVVSLSDNLNGLSGDAEKETALAELLKAAGKPEYVQKITNLGTAMAEVKAGLTLPNAAIDMSSATLGKLITALAMDGELDTAAVSVPYLESVTLTAKDNSAVNVQAIVTANGKSDAVATPSVIRGTVMDAATIATLKADIEKTLVKLVGEAKAPYYTAQIDGDLDALVGKALDQNVNVYYDYVADSFTVKIDGEADQTINVENLEVTLPTHSKYPAYTYEYTVKGEVKSVRANAVKYNFAIADLATLFADGTYTITREENNKNQTDFEGAFETEINDIVYDAEGNIVGLTSNVDASQGGLMDFAMEIMNSGYSYIALNDEVLLNTYTNDAGENITEISLQTMINALLNDNAFGSARLIGLGHGTEKTLVTAKMTIRSVEEEELFEDIDFTLNLKTIPEKLVTVANGLDAIKNYMTFQSKDGIMDVQLNLPDPVYEVYLTALLATSNLEKTDMNAVNHAIAFNFLDDYLEMVMAETDISADTYENTLNMMIKEFNEIADKELDSVELSEYDKYYSMLERALNGETVELIANPDDYTVTISAKAEDIDEAISIIGIDVSAYEGHMNMIKELKEGGVISGVAIATLEDVNVDYEAALIDLARRETNRKTVEKVFDYTSDLPARVADLKGEAAIILLDDVDGNLTFNQTAILDLNGQTINGNITANGRKLFIVDSSMDTVSGGAVNGTISGDVVILAGTYSSDVSAFLKDGYVQEDGSVHNAVYYYENGNIVVNTNFMFEDSVDGYLPAVHYLAVDVAIDVILNYYTAASLTIEGNDIYAISFDDLVGILGTDSHSGKVANLVDDLLAMIRFDGDKAEGTGGIDDLVNMIVEDLLDLEGIYESVANGTKIGDYTITTKAWDVTVKYMADGDYITAGVTPNDEITNSITLSLTMDGSNKDKTLSYIRELCNVVVEEETYLTIDLDQPYRDGKTLVLSGGAEGMLSLDFSHNDEYVRLLCTLLAYGNPDAFGDIANADVEDLLAAIDATTVGEVFTALKVVAEKAGYKVVDKIEGKFDVDLEAVAEKVTFETIANKVGVELTDAQLAKLEELYDKFMNGVCKILNKLDLSDNTTPMSKWKIAEGLYYIDGDIKTHNGDAYYRGYGVDVTVETLFAGLKIKLAETCLWGDANHDGLVNAKDATLVLQYSVGALADDQFFCTKRTDVNGDGEINAKDATLILQYAVLTITKFPAEG